MEETHLIKPVLDKEYPIISHGKGIYLYDTKGKKYLDGSSGAITASIGHGVQEIIDVMADQAKKVSFVYRSQFTNEPAEQLAKKMSELTSSDFHWSFFVNSGSEATETAMKIAIQYWQERNMKGKNKILSRWMSYHGITIGALSMSGHLKRRARFISLLDDLPIIPPPYCYRCPYHSTYPSCELMCATELERVIKRIGAENIAAFIAEPIIGAAAGALIPPSNYYQTIKDICERNNILFIADEVMTGLGRTGKMFAINHWNVEPDIITLGKGLSGGYTPIASTLVSDHVMQPFIKGSKTIMSGHTFSANPQSAAVALAVINYVEKHNLVVSAEKKGYSLMEKLDKLRQNNPIIGDVRGKGLLIGVEFVSDIFSKLPFKEEVNVTDIVVHKAQERGLLVYPANAGTEGVGGDAVLIAPPLTISNEEIDELVNLFEISLQEVQKELQIIGM
ncbi:aspartate aminotransferase family protein [Bacillus sp. SM2101]|uniref:aspartate aminotransferase family protein n=1 Tax=Bacillaceae TaxID=186817 RepID=UPI001BDE9F0F|nr:aspartate aminotransferase family protein [Bacillus sp. SM2101]